MYSSVAEILPEETPSSLGCLLDFLIGFFFRNLYNYPRKLFETGEWSCTRVEPRNPLDCAWTHFRYMVSCPYMTWAEDRRFLKQKWHSKDTIKPAPPWMAADTSRSSTCI